MAIIVIVYHSGYGHTAQVARAVARGAEAAGGPTVKLIPVVNVQGDFAPFIAADAIIFGCPTYMGSASAKMKEFIESASKLWFKQEWKDKIAAGFTNSGSFSGDKLATLEQLMLNAMQHGMIWVGTALMPAESHDPSGPRGDQVNRMGGFIGAMASSINAPPDQVPPAGDLQTAELLGRRVADITKQFIRGRQR